MASNRAPHQPCRACTAQSQAATQAQQPRRWRKVLDPWRWQYVRTHLEHGCSPKTIYTALYVLPRGTLRSELLDTVRQARKASLPRARGQDRRGQILNITSITNARLRSPVAGCPVTEKATY